MSWIIAIVGIVINFMILGKWMDDSPEGGMGMGMLLIPCFIPYALVVMCVIGGVVHAVNWVWKILTGKGFLE